MEDLILYLVHVISLPWSSFIVYLTILYVYEVINY